MKRGEATAPELLREAARLIHRARLQLDKTQVSCCTCEQPVHRNQVHGKAAAELENMELQLVVSARRVELATDDMGSEAFKVSCRAAARGGKVRGQLNKGQVK